MTITLATAGLVMAVGALAGALGSLLGIGGGVFLVPFLVLVIGLPMRAAVAISLLTVIATSTAVSASSAGSHLINIRLGMLLEVATAAGALAGGITAQVIPAHTLQILFGVSVSAIALVTLSRLNRRNVLLDADPGELGGRFYEEESGRTVTYRVKRLPVALAGSFVAGNLSSLLGIGGGIVKVPMLNAWCGVPVRAAAATSAFMIGVTASGGAIIYYGHGDVIPLLAAPAVIGVRLGSWVGVRLAARARARWLKLLLAIVLLVVGVLMLVRGM